MVAMGVFFHAMFTGLAGEIDIVRQSGEAWFADISWSLRPGDLETDANQVFAHLYVCMLYVVCIGNSVRSVRPNFYSSRRLGLGREGWVAVCPWPNRRACTLGCVLVRLSGCSLVCNPVHFRTLSRWGGYGYTVFLCIGTIKQCSLCRKVLYSAKVRSSRQLNWKDVTTNEVKPNLIFIVNG